MIKWHQLCDCKSEFLSYKVLLAHLVYSLSLNFKVSTNNIPQVIFLNLFLTVVFHVPFIVAKSCTACTLQILFPTSCVITSLWLKHPPINTLVLISPHPFKPPHLQLKSQRAQAKFTRAYFLFVRALNIDNLPLQHLMDKWADKV